MASISFPDIDIESVPFRSGYSFSSEISGAGYDVMMLTRDTIALIRNSNDVAKYLYPSIMATPEFLATLGQGASILSLIGGMIGLYQSVDTLKEDIRHEYFEGKVLSTIDLMGSLGVTTGATGYFLSKVCGFSQQIAAQLGTVFLASGLIFLGIMGYKMVQYKELQRAIEECVKPALAEKKLENLYNLFVERMGLTPEDIRYIIEHKEQQTFESDNRQLENKVYRFIQKYDLSQAHKRVIRSLIIMHNNVDEMRDKHDPLLLSKLVNKAAYTLLNTVKINQTKKWFGIVATVLFLSCAIISMITNIHWIMMAVSIIYLIEIMVVITDHLLHKYSTVYKAARISNKIATRTLKRINSIKSAKPAEIELVPLRSRFVSTS